MCSNGEQEITANKRATLLDYERHATLMFDHNIPVRKDPFSCKD